MDDYTVSIKKLKNGNKKIIARGGDWPELFEACGKALAKCMIDLDTVSEEYEERLSLKRGEITELLFDFLSDIVLGIKEDRGIVFSDYKLQINKEGTQLEGMAKGEALVPNKHLLHTDVTEISFDDFIAEKEEIPPEGLEDKPYYAEMVVVCM